MKYLHSTFFCQEDMLGLGLDNITECLHTKGEGRVVTLTCYRQIPPTF